MKAISLRQFLQAALEEQHPFFILFGFSRTSDELHDWSLLSASIPWLHHPGCDYSKFCEDLRRHGLAIVACESAEEARKLRRETRCRRLWVDTTHIDEGQRLEVEPR
jgi:hypothetical protein